MTIKTYRIEAKELKPNCFVYIRESKLFFYVDEVELEYEDEDDENSDITFVNILFEEGFHSLFGLISLRESYEADDELLVVDMDQFLTHSTKN